MVDLATLRYPTKGNQGIGSDVAKATNGELGGGCYAVGQRGDSGNEEERVLRSFGQRA
jgi:hypothetical protein